jgi:anti-anti-sigma regulatory factor
MLLTYRSSAWQRERTVAWVAEALAHGHKVLHRAVTADPLGVDLGERGRSALESGQLQVVDANTLYTQTGGLHRAVRDLHEELVNAAFGEGYPGVVLTADERALRVIVPEPAERLAHEHDLERLVGMPGVRVLCCYDLRVEQHDLLEAVSAAHYRCVDDELWSVRVSGTRMSVRGEIDAGNAGRFGAALNAAVAHGVRAVDLAELTVLSAAGMRAIDAAIDLAEEYEDRLLLVNLTPTVRRAVTVLRPSGEQVPLFHHDIGEDLLWDSRLVALARALTVLTDVLLDGPTVAEVLDRITEAARYLVPGADLASVTLRGADGTFHTPARTGAEAEVLDRIQYVLHEGPCLDAARTSAAAAVEDLAGAAAWPRFGQAAMEHGVRSVVAAALLPDAVAPRRSGSLNVYSRRAGAFSAGDRDVLLLLASHASLVLAATAALDRAELANTELWQAIGSREVLGEAKAVLMGRRGLSADEAFAVLGRLSRRLEERVAGLADALALRQTSIDLTDRDS